MKGLKFTEVVRMETNYWIILGLLLLIGEVFTLDFSLSCFGVACFAAAALSALGLGAAWQLAAVAVMIFALLFTLRPLALKYLNSAKDFKANVDALIGATATVAEVDAANPRKGMVKIDADHWTVSAAAPLKTGESVKIEKIDGTTLIVNKQEGK
jgi:membrane protein implicated in regulation of membrane protease activity